MGGLRPHSWVEPNGMNPPFIADLQGMIMNKQKTSFKGLMKKTNHATGNFAERVAWIKCS
jgi:hypothetical protein